MNKLYKYILIGIALFSLGFAQAEAENFNEQYYTTIQHGLFSNNFFGVSSNQRNIRFYNGNISNKYICVAGNMNTNFDSNSNLQFTLYTCGTEKGASVILGNQSDCTELGTLDHVYNAAQLDNVQNDYCYDTEEVGYMYITTNIPPSSTKYVYFSFYFSDGENAMTKNECEVNYSLIPIEEIDQNYCESNNLCTVCNDTPGEINTGVSRSSLFLNGTQINSNAIIDIYADDRLNTEVEYLNETVDINITQNIDTSYIEGVKNKEKLTPTNEDVEYMIQGLQVYIPYIFIGLIIVYTLYLIKKFFRG